MQSITLTPAVRDTRELCACSHCPASFDWGVSTRTSVLSRTTSELRLRFACARVPRSPCRCAVVCRRTTGVLCAMALIALQCVDAFAPATPASLQVACYRLLCVRARASTSPPVSTPLMASLSEFRAVQRTLTRLETRSACTLARRRPARTRSHIHMLIPNLLLTTLNSCAPTLMHSHNHKLAE